MTSRGQQNWFGSQYMNRKFEPEKRSQFNYMLLKKKIGKPPQGRVDLENWVDSVQNSSKWATRDDQAHQKYMQLYSNQVEQISHYENAAAANTYGGMNNPAVAQPIRQNNP